MDDQGFVCQIISYLTTHAHPIMRKNVSFSRLVEGGSHQPTDPCHAEPAHTDHRPRPDPAVGTGEEPGADDRRYVSFPRPMNRNAADLCLFLLAGYIWKEFTSQSDYEAVVSHARALDCVLWDNPVTRMFFVTPAGHESCRGLVMQWGNGAIH